LGIIRKREEQAATRHILGGQTLSFDEGSNAETEAPNPEGENQERPIKERGGGGKNSKI